MSSFRYTRRTRCGCCLRHLGGGSAPQRASLTTCSNSAWHACAAWCPEAPAPPPPCWAHAAAVRATSAVTAAADTLSGRMGHLHPYAPGSDEAREVLRERGALALAQGD